MSRRYPRISERKRVLNFSAIWDAQDAIARERVQLRKDRQLVAAVRAKYLRLSGKDPYTPGGARYMAIAALNLAEGALNVALQDIEEEGADIQDILDFVRGRVDVAHVLSALTVKHLPPDDYADTRAFFNLPDNASKQEVDAYVDAYIEEFVIEKG